MAEGGGRTKAASGGRGSTLWMQGLACGALLTFAAPTALLLSVLLAPAIACALGERDAGNMVRAVALCCAAAAMGPAWHLWMAGGGMAAALLALSDPTTLVAAWGIGACAWALCQVLPVVVRTTWETREAIRARAIETELERLREDWEIESGL